MINMNNLYNTPYIPVSWGELIDKITILEIKSLKIKSASSNKNILLELDSLVALIGKFHFPEEFSSLKSIYICMEDEESEQAFIEYYNRIFGSKDDQRDKENTAVSSKLK